MTIETALESFGEKAKAKIIEWAGDAETFVEAEADAGLNAVETTLKAIGPALWAQGQSLVNAAMKSLGAGATLDAVGTSLLNGLEADAKAAWPGIETNLFTAVVSSMMATAEALI